MGDTMFIDLIEPIMTFILGATSGGLLVYFRFPRRIVKEIPADAIPERGEGHKHVPSIQGKNKGLVQLKCAICGETWHRKMNG